ncbi:MAG: transporter substrate-binding domain-containing protein [Alphaproteobacteria bacterium]|nr:transporter substrate-binding domain-containing protein [Alphaproteobacteria bacterium]
MYNLLIRLSFFILFSVCFCFSAQAGTTLSRIKQTGVIRCGARTTADAYAYRTENEWQGIDVEICRLIASAILGRSQSIQIIPVNQENGFQLLENGQIDILNAATPWTMDKELSSNASFPSVFYYSALAFIGHYKPEATSMKDYQGAKVCVEGTPFLTQELEAYNKRHGLEMRIMKLPSLSRAKELLYLKRCDLIFARLETLHSEYFKKSPPDVDLVVLPEIVRTYPVGPYIRDDDKELFKLLRWLIYAVIKAEEKGISSQNIEDFQNTEDPEIQNLLGQDKQSADKLGVDNGWIYRAIAEQGNYGEIYQKGLGNKSVLKLNRTANKLAKDGGLIQVQDFQK